MAAVGQDHDQRPDRLPLAALHIDDAPELAEVDLCNLARRPLRHAQRRRWRLPEPRIAGELTQGRVGDCHTITQQELMDARQLQAVLLEPGGDPFSPLLQHRPSRRGHASWPRPWPGLCHQLPHHLFPGRLAILLDAGCLRQPQVLVHAVAGHAARSRDAASTLTRLPAANDLDDLHCMHLPKRHAGPP